VSTLDNLRWHRDRPLIIGQWFGAMLDMVNPQEDWPPECPGIYVVGLRDWRQRPTQAHEILYVGCSRNLLGRANQLVPMLLGFFDSGDGADPIGQHPGWRIRTYCYEKNLKVGDLRFGWAKTTVPCDSCVEQDLIASLQPQCNQGRSRAKCCCST
jgi:hypothetical protein